MRLDNYLVENGFFESRNKAQEAIKSGKVLVDNTTITKPSFKVTSNNIKVKQNKFYVSRAAKKLEEYLKEFFIDFKDKRVLDVGSSTGGFTQIALENGAKSVDCVDVGSNQLHPTLRENSKVNVYENMDIRDFKGEKYDIIISDVSFISLLKIVNSINHLAKNNTIITLLFKPQFEVGKDAKRDKRGVVQDKEAIKIAKENFLKETQKLNWTLLDNKVSKISGKEGNIEEFFTFKK